MEIAAASSGVTGRAALSVEAPVAAAVSVRPDTVSFMALGDTARLSAEVLDQFGRTLPGAAVSWLSGDPSVAAVDSSGLVTAVGAGAATVTATADSVSGSAAVRVMQSAGSVVVTPAEATVAPGDTVRLSAAALDANGHPVAGAEFSWSSSDESVAAVDDSGLVTGVAAGTVEIAAASSGVTGRATVSVEAPAPTVSLSSDAASAPEGGTVVLGVALSTPAASDVSFTYVLGTDDDDATADADAADYSHGTTGSVRIAAGAGSAEIEIAINDDDDIEPTREVFTVTLDIPGDDVGYARGFLHAAAVTIEEGVCDRTPLVRDEIMMVAGVADCAGTDDQALASIRELDITGDMPWQRSERSVVWTRELAARIRSGACDAGDWGFGPETAAEPGKCADAGGSAVPQRGRAPGASEAVTTLREGDFAGLSNLGVLYLRELGLTELPAGVFAGLRRLYWLSLQYNELTSLPAGIFSDLTNLWEGLILANNRLASLPAAGFAGLFPDPETSDFRGPGLLILELNELTEVPAHAFTGLTGVDWLWLNDNRLTDLRPGVFSGLSGVTSLHLERNRLRTLPAGVFSGVTGRDLWLFLSHNELVDLPPGIFSDLPGLTTLKLARNRLRSAELLSESDLSGLTTLELWSNPLMTLRRSDFAGMPDLQGLYLSGIGLRNLTPGLFSDLGQLEELQLMGNALNELPAGALLGLSRLRRLRVDANPGSPFPLTLQLRRTDSGDPLAPGPATVGVALAQGAPLNISIPVSAHGGEISAGTVVLRAGSDQSDEVTVTRPVGNPSATQIVAGPVPDLSSGVRGVELFVSDPLVLFAAAANRAPVPDRPIPWLRMQAGGESGSVDAASYFRDPDGDALTYTAVSDRPDVASAEASGGRVTVVPLAAGSAEVTVTATDPDGLSAQSSLRVGVRGASPGAYDIDLFLIDEVSPSIRAAFDDAVVYWSSILAGTELSDVPITGDFRLGCWDLTTSQTVPVVDELVIVASVTKIDGFGGTLASAGYCGVREGEGGLPFMGAMQFDVDDLEWLAERGDMEEVIVHEMGHVLGIGTIWRRFGLLANPSLGAPGHPDAHFRGPLTIAAFDEAGGTTYADGEKVPVENRAGPGSSDAHWRESVLDHELMTPFQNGGVSDPLSAITIQSLADLGYIVDVSLAEPYLLPGAAAVADPARKIEYGDDILRGPIIVVGRDGRVQRVVPGDGR